jgi:hypothetical protein
MRSADPCEIMLDKYFGKVNYSLNGEFQLSFGMRDANSDSLLSVR